MGSRDRGLFFTLSLTRLSDFRKLFAAISC
jgi:hypothetical protein